MTGNENINAVEGDDVLLLCSYNTFEESNFAVSWYKTNQMINGKPDISNAASKIWTYDNAQPADKQDQVFGNSMGSVERANSDIPETSGHSIRIKNVTLQEEAVYVCQLELNYGTKTRTANTMVNVISECEQNEFCCY